jgi:hypothetical protein
MCLFRARYHLGFAQLGGAAPYPHLGKKVYPYTHTYVHFYQLADMIKLEVIGWRLSPPPIVNLSLLID